MQNGHAQQWAKTLRSRSPSPNAHHERRQHGAPNATGGESQLSKSADFTGNVPNGSAKVGRAHSGGSSLTRSNEEYIMSLQQQVHFLEMDAARVRLEAQAAAEMHPKMTAEAERMLVKLRELQVSVDDLTLQLQRVEAEIEHAVGDRNVLNTRLDSEISLRAKDRQMLAHEVALARKGKEDAAIDGVRKESVLRAGLEKNEELRHVLRQVEERNVELSTLLDQRAEEHCLTLIALEEKVAHLALASNHLTSTTLRYAENAALSRDKTVSKLKAEVQLLRRALGIPTASITTTTPTLTKQGTRALTLTEENGLLRERNVELQTRITMEKNLRNSMTLQLEEETAEVARLYTRTKDLLLQLQLQHAHLGSPRQERSKLEDHNDSHALRYDGRHDHAMSYLESDRTATAMANHRTVDVIPPSGDDKPRIQENEPSKRLDDENASKQRKSTSFSDINSAGNRRVLKRDDTNTTEAKVGREINSMDRGRSALHLGQRQPGVAKAEVTSSMDRANVPPKPTVAAKAVAQNGETSTGSQEKTKQVKINGTPIEHTANRRPSDSSEQPGCDSTERKSLHDTQVADVLSHPQPAAGESTRPWSADRAPSSADYGNTAAVAVIKSVRESDYVQIDVPLNSGGQVKDDMLLLSNRSTAPSMSTAEAKQTQTQQQQHQQQHQQHQHQQQLLPEFANKKELVEKQHAHKSLTPLLQQGTRDSESGTAQMDAEGQQSTSEREAIATTPARRRSLNDDLALARQQQQQQKRHQVHQTGEESQKLLQTLRQHPQPQPQPQQNQQQQQQ